jgi:predicted nicotinamide N-methyase
MSSVRGPPPFRLRERACPLRIIHKQNTAKKLGADTSRRRLISPYMSLSELFATDEDMASNGDATPPAIIQSFTLNQTHPGKHTGLTPVHVKIRSYGTCFGATTGMDVWPAAFVLSNLFACGELQLPEDAAIFEIGSGTGLTSLGSAIGAGVTGVGARVVATDWNDAWLLENLKHNLTGNLNAEALSDANAANISVEMYGWGDQVGEKHFGMYDVVVLCDVIYATANHKAQLYSASQLLKETGRCIVAFCTANQSANAVAGFQQIATREFGLECTVVNEVKLPDDNVVKVWSFCRTCIS